MRIGGSSFTQGMQLGRGIYQDAQVNRRADAADARAQAEADRQAAADQRAAADRADLDYIGKGGVTGITPNMTVPGPSGVGPVANPADIDVNYRGGMPASMADTPPGVPGAAPVAATAPAMPPAAPAAGVAPTVGMSPDEQASRIAAIQLRNGNSAGFYASQDRAKELKFQAGYDKYAKSLMEMDDKQFADHIHSVVTDNPKSPAKIKYDPKTMMMTVTHDDGSTQEMTRAQGMMHLLSGYEMGNGKVDIGIQKQLALYNQRKQEVDTAANQDNQATGIMAGQNLKVTTEARNQQLAVAKIKLEEAQGNRMAAIAARGASAGEGFKLAPGVTDAAGNPIMMNAKGEYKTATGLKFMKDPSQGQPPSRKEIFDAAKSMVDSGAKNANGKPMTLEDAMPRAVELLTGKAGSDGIDTKAVADYLAKGNSQPGSAAATAAVPSGPVSNPSNARPQNVSPMESQLNQETLEMNNMRRMKYSPEVQAFIDQRDAAAAAARQADSEAQRAAMFRRDQAMRLGR